MIVTPSCERWASALRYSIITRSEAPALERIAPEAPASTRNPGSMEPPSLRFPRLESPNEGIHSNHLKSASLGKWPTTAIRCLGLLTCLAILVCSCSIANAQPPAPPTKTPAVAPAVRQHLILIVGASGTDEYKETFLTWATRWQDAAKRAEADCTFIGDAESTAKDLEKLTTSLGEMISVETNEPLWIVFIGHGTFDGRTASLNLNGPDVSAEKMAELLRPAKRPIAFVACASCTSPFINALSAPNRIIISATKDGNQIQYSRFGDAMSQAIGGLDADINRDGQTSLLEAWLFASRRTAEFYATEGRLATEHALIDDNGDTKGTRAEVYDGERLKLGIENAEQLDGAQAARWNFIRSEEERRLSPEQRQTRDALEQRLDDLRLRKVNITEAEYLTELESILVPIAELYESLD